MFNKNVEITIMTRLENEDNFKVEKFCEAFKKSGTKLTIIGLCNGDVKIRFTTIKSCVNKLKDYMNVLYLIGIKAEMEIK